MSVHTLSSITTLTTILHFVQYVLNQIAGITEILGRVSEIPAVIQHEWHLSIAECVYFRIYSSYTLTYSLINMQEHMHI